VDPFHDRPQPVYRCLEGKAADARYLVFRDSGSDVEYRFHPCDALELSDFTVAVREGREAALYAYRRETGSWQKTAARFQPYHELDGGCRAALV
jgi:hypothetical protein